MVTSIRRGVRLLDEVYPEWYEWIDLDELDMADGTCCVLGQIGLRLGHGGFDAQSQFMGLSEEAEEEFGFWIDRDEEYLSLTRRWKQAIRRRLRR